MPSTTISHVLLELVHVSKSLHEVILTSPTRKNKVNDLIKMMNPKRVETSTFQAPGPNEGNDVKNDVEKGDSEIEDDVGGSEDDYESVSYDAYGD